MTKIEIIKEVSLKTDIPEPTVSKVLHSILESIEQSLVRGERVDLRLFGNFVPVIRRKKGRNFITGENLTPQNVKFPKFKPSPYLQEHMNLIK